MLFFFLIEFCKPCVIQGLVRNFSSFLVNSFKNAWVSNRLSIYDRYSFVEKNLLLSNFLPSRLRILNFVTGIFEKYLVKNQIVEDGTRISM